KAERREQARLARELKEQQARAERERQALLAKERSRRSAKASQDRPAPLRRADKPVSPEPKSTAARAATDERPQRRPKRVNAPRQAKQVKRAKQKAKARARAERSRPKALWLAGVVLVTAVLAWLLLRR